MKGRGAKIDKCKIFFGVLCGIYYVIGVCVLADSLTQDMSLSSFLLLAIKFILYLVVCYVYYNIQSKRIKDWTCNPKCPPDTVKKYKKHRVRLIACSIIHVILGLAFVFIASVAVTQILLAAQLVASMTLIPMETYYIFKISDVAEYCNKEIQEINRRLKDPAVIRERRIAEMKETYKIKSFYDINYFTIKDENSGIYVQKTK